MMRKLLLSQLLRVLYEECVRRPHAILSPLIVYCKHVSVTSESELIDGLIVSFLDCIKRETQNIYQFLKMFVSFKRIIYLMCVILLLSVQFHVVNTMLNAIKHAEINTRSFFTIYFLFMFSYQNICNVIHSFLSCQNCVFQFFLNNGRHFVYPHLHVMHTSIKMQFK